jgi:superfamily I DNA/RNA helicase
MFERYDKCMKELGLWDDCDRIAALFNRLESVRASDPVAYQNVRYNKVYVDEVQDYTQAEIAVFFCLCGPGDLFLAGDPAQSVVEGVEFRFEEIRSVGYCLYGEERKHLVPDKPRTVHLNFRSHCGILNVAAAVLSCLFEVFPDSAKQLKEDLGLFHGPRPGVFNKVEVERLKELVVRRGGIVVLTHDRDVPRWKRALDYPLV